MSETFFKIIGSEFLWGTLLGILLTYVGGIFTLWGQRKNQEKIITEFCVDAISNIGEYVSTLDQFRDRSKTIYKDFIDLIEVEIQIYGRNREHLISIRDRKVRKRFRDYFTAVTTNLFSAKRHLENFETLYKSSQSEADLTKKNQLESVADIALKEAHKACDKLVSIVNKNEDLKSF